MLWTLFKLLIIVWMAQMVLRFGGIAIQVVLVVSLAALLLRQIIRRLSFNPDRLRDSVKSGRLNSAMAEHFAGAPKVNSSFHNRI
jgi:hypothetical protein